jgi:hypothetical protein
MFNSAPPEELARIHLQDGRQGEVIRIPLGQPNLGACEPRVKVPYIDRPRRDGLSLQLTKEMTLHLFIPLAESPILFIATRIHTQLRELPTRLATRIIEAALHLSSADREWLRQERRNSF